MFLHKVTFEKSMIQKKNLRKYSTHIVCHPFRTTLYNDVIPHMQVFMSAFSYSTISAIQAFQMALSPNGQVTQLSRQSNSGLIGATYMFSNQMTQYQQPSSQLGQVMILQYQPISSAAEILHLVNIDPSKHSQRTTYLRKTYSDKNNDALTELDSKSSIINHTCQAIYSHKTWCGYWEIHIQHKAQDT
ncbi:hypothetical protein QTP88_021761 [Uroleucon formosanum]